MSIKTDGRAAAVDAAKIEALAGNLKSIAPVTIAVSGGVDSMTLAAFANRTLGPGAVAMAHAASPAVPTAARVRVERLAASEGWRLSVVDAGELADANYRVNPINRCYFCKSNLYGTLQKLADMNVASGANCDDLGDYRPGLTAAAEFGVYHPYIAAGMSKSEVRGLAGQLGLGDLAELPSSPCLSSRVETGIAISADQLHLIDRVESWLAAHIEADHIRCRIRKSGLVLEFDREALAALGTGRRREIVDDLQRGVLGREFPAAQGFDISFAPYQQGSAFVGDRNAAPNRPVEK